MDKKRLLICHTKLGKMYINAIKSDKYEFGDILGTGSRRTCKLADKLGVPCYMDMTDAIEKLMVCVIFPNAEGGGKGSAIDYELLKNNIPTLFEHRIYQKEIVECLKILRRQLTPFMLNPSIVIPSRCQSILSLKAIYGK